jgi:hypothetical protein
MEADVTQQKFCKDCKHYRAAFLDYHRMYVPEGCLAGDLERDVVTGAVIAEYPRTARSSVGKCGLEGKLWEAKPGPPPQVDPSSWSV